MPHQPKNEFKVSLKTGRAKREAGVCQLLFCTTPASKGKSCCAKHTHQLHKLFDPISYIYSKRKQRAKERGHDWTITIENFRDWCAWNNYHLLTGRTCTSLSIERKDPLHGYHIWNITTLSLACNSAKSTRPPGGQYYQDAKGVTHYVFVDTDGQEYAF